MIERLVQCGVCSQALGQQAGGEGEKEKALSWAPAPEVLPTASPNMQRLLRVVVATHWPKALKNFKSHTSQHPKWLPSKGQNPGSQRVRGREGGGARNQKL